MQNMIAYPIESVDNALRLIVLLGQYSGQAGPDGAAAGPGLGVAEAARRLGVAPSTAHRVLAMLRHHGFAIQDSRRRYHLGPVFARVGQGGRQGRDLRAAMRPHLGLVSRQLQETVHLMVLQGTAVRFLEGVEATHALRVGTRAGMVLPAHCTSGGKAMLAQLTRTEVDALYAHGLPDIYGPALADLPALRGHLTTVRRRGYAINREESERGITGVGVCLRDTDGRVHGAMAVAMPTARCPNSRIPEVGRLLRQTADGLAGELLDVA
jgi:IclR family transcriptional regulator, acetate operon repressor